MRSAAEEEYTGKTWQECEADKGWVVYLAGLFVAVAAASVAQGTASMNHKLYLNIFSKIHGTDSTTIIDRQRTQLSRETETRRQGGRPVRVQEVLRLVRRPPCCCLSVLHPPICTHSDSLRYAIGYEKAQLHNDRSIKHVEQGRV